MNNLNTNPTKETEMLKKYSVVIPTYNHCEDLLKPCLESIKQYTDLQDVEVIVVANGCKDNTREYVESLGEPFNLVWSDEAWGYTKSTNEGIKVSTGEYVVLLNNDTVLLHQEKNTWLKMLQQPFEDPKVGITGPMQAHCPYAKKDFLIFFCVMVRREMFDKVGLLDEIFNPGFGEDTDFCVKLQDLGYQIVQVPDQKHVYSRPNFMVGNMPIYHKGEGTFADWPGGHKLLSERRFMLMNRYSENIKLNLGSGDRPVTGYFNIDIANPKADLLCDARKIPLDDNRVDEITAYHLLEHFKYQEVEDVLREWKRVLKIDGKLILEFPDVEALFHKFGTADINERKHILHCVFGAHTPDFPHLYGWFSQAIWETLNKLGFRNIAQLPAQVEHWGINMRIECQKGANLPEGFFADHDIATYREWFKNRIPVGGRVAELGCWKGRSLASVADIIKEKKIEVIAIDTFEGSVSESEGQASPIDAKKDNIYPAFVDNMETAGISPSVFIANTHDASAIFPDNHFDMVFIDADHSYASARQDIQDWWPKVKRGGFLAGHDCQWKGVADALTDEFGHLVLTNWANMWWHDKGKVYDCFPFCNELDQLEIRLNELNDEVDYFVLVEGTETHSGEPKPLYFEENKERFKAWLPKIRHIVVDKWPVYDPNSTDSPWARERTQRQAILEGIQDAGPYDILILGDADEIMSAKALKGYRRYMGMMRLEQNLYYYFLNYQSTDHGGKWQESRIVPVAEFREKKMDPCFARYYPDTQIKNLKDAGWHFSFQGGVDEVIRKVQSYSHQEYNKPEILNRDRVERMIEEGKDVFGRENMTYRTVDIDDTFPKYLQNNQHKFRRMIRCDMMEVAS
jgi:beta-1,4-mannosyl-glycoprotein beta-1,4-N-acetylglucosaminyltransferase